jgi:diguanylate cyclase (GGDEF)-like protein
VNDRFGHLEGNRLLQRVAGILKENRREQDYVARMGGDEFVMLLHNADAAQSQHCVSSICRKIEEMSLRLYGELILSASFGVAHAPKDGVDPEQLLFAADSRMYQMKNKRRAEYAAGQQLIAVCSAIESEQQSKAVLPTS